MGNNERFVVLIILYCRPVSSLSFYLTLYNNYTSRVLNQNNNITVLYYRAWDLKIQSTLLPSQEKNSIFVSVYSSYTVHRNLLKSIVDTCPSPKIFLFLSTYYGAWNLEKIQSPSTPAEKKNIFSDYSTMVHETLEEEKFSLNFRQKKKYFCSYGTSMLHMI